MKGISRRSLIGGAGAGLMLAGCQHKGDNDSNNRPKNGREMHRSRNKVKVLRGEWSGDYGECELYGQSAAYVDPDTAGFNPDHICALYIRFKSNGKIIIRHAYICATDKTDSAVIAITQPLLEAMVKGVYPPSLKVVRPEENFNNFSMSSQQILVIFIDNDPAVVGFNETNGLDHIVRFTPYSGKNPNGPQVQPNWAFSDLRPIKFKKPKLSHNKAYRIDFHNTDEGGKPINSNSNSSTWYVYSMNIHLRQVSGISSNIYIPLILDPDTGNMGSRP